MPTKFSGWMNYKPGETFYAFDKSAPQKLRTETDRTDHCAIYAIFYEPSASRPYINGDKPLSESNPTIISTAQLPAEKCTDTDGWVKFEEAFIMRAGKSIDPVKLRQGKYSLALVFSSSAEGDLFSGAIGSSLKIDSVVVEFQNEDQ